MAELPLEKVDKVRLLLGDGQFFASQTIPDSIEPPSSIFIMCRLLYYKRTDDEGVHVYVASQLHPVNTAEHYFQKIFEEVGVPIPDDATEHLARMRAYLDEKIAPADKNPPDETQLDD